MRMRVPVITLLALALCLLTLNVSSAQDKKVPPQTAKKYQGVPKDAIEGAVKSVDMAKSTFTVTLSTKKDRTFAVDKATEFWGPKGGDRGTGPAGLKDDCMAAGYVIHVSASKDGKTATDV
ncbi:MAG TPA: hypothetical protein VE988_04745, partial [Gemmataceae bacterium]|nr:hypothetical protein [Gemmataceae bacterium]